MTPEEVTQALQRLARQARLSGSPREAAERALRLDAHYGDYLYLRGAHGLEEDCLGGALVAGKYLDLQGRYMWAMALSKAPVLEEFEKALGAMVSMAAVMQAALWTVVTLLVLLAIPEPVTKFVAAWATVALILWVGAHALYKLITGWFELMEEVKGATSFEEIREAGEKFGRVFSREAAQAFALLRLRLVDAGDLPLVFEPSRSVPAATRAHPQALGLSDNPLKTGVPWEEM